MKRRQLLGVAALGIAALYLSSRAEPTPPPTVEATNSQQPALLTDVSEPDQSDDLISTLPTSGTTFPDDSSEDAETTGYSLSGDAEIRSFMPAERQHEFDETRALDDARREIARRGYRGFCTSDCEGHEAGHRWAHENRLTRPGYTYDSQSFDEGQEAYVRDVKRRVEEERSEFESDPDRSEYQY